MTNFLSDLTINGNTVWHAGNDGPGSGLDADTLDGLHASDITGGTSRTIDPTNLATNPGFELPTLEGYDTTAGDQNIGFLLDTTFGPHSGAQQGRVAFQASQTGAAYLGIGGAPGSPDRNQPAAYGDTFFFGLWYKDQPGAVPTIKPRIFAQMRKADGTYINSMAVLARSPNTTTNGTLTGTSSSAHTWHWVEFRVNDPATAYVWFAINFEPGNPADRRCLIDDIVIRRRQYDPGAFTVYDLEGVHRDVSNSYLILNGDKDSVGVLGASVVLYGSAAPAGSEHYGQLLSNGVQALGWFPSGVEVNKAANFISVATFEAGVKMGHNDGVRRSVNNQFLALRGSPTNGEGADIILYGGGDGNLKGRLRQDGADKLIWNTSGVTVPNTLTVSGTLIIPVL